MGSCLPGTPRMNQNPSLRWTLMIAQPQSLIEVFAEIPDFRCCRGKRHPLPAILSLACGAMLCGYRTYSLFQMTLHSFLSHTTLIHTRKFTTIILTPRHPPYPLASNGLLRSAHQRRQTDTSLV